MQRGEVQSKLRNPVLAGVLSTIPGYMEQIGSGVRFMLDETKRLDLPAPQFREMDEVMVTFQKAPALRAPEPRLPYQGETLWEEQEAAPTDIVVQDRRAKPGRKEAGSGVALCARTWVYHQWRLPAIDRCHR